MSPLSRSERLSHGSQYSAIVEAVTQRQPTVTSGPLAGVTLALKDMVNVRGRAPGLGLNARPETAPTEHASVVDVLLDAGMDLVAFTEMTPLAFEPSGGNPWRGRPRNPWNADYICGGSSSGSAVAVAVDSVRVALGSDTAGSLRIPAHCCGISAWKPTHGLVPTNGAMALAPTLDAIGFLARSAMDLSPVAALFSQSNTTISTLRVARDLIEQSAADTQAAMSVAETAFAEIVTVEAVDLKPLIDACDNDVMMVLQGEAARATAALAANRPLDATLVKRLSKGHAVTDEMLDDARARLRDQAARAAASLFAAGDAVMLPVMHIQTPKVSACEPSHAEFSARTLYQLSAFTRFVNGFGWPAVAVPIGFDSNGLPIGCQIVGPPGSDNALIKLALQFQQVTDWHLRTPPGLS